MTDAERIELLEKQVAELQEFARSLVVELNSAYVRLEDGNTAWVTMDHDYLFQERMQNFTKKTA